MSDQNIEVLKKETYLKTIENSVGSRIFNSLFVRFKDTGKVVDVLNDGEYSCAFFVSGILYLFQVIDKPYSTVDSFRKFLETDIRWQKIGTEKIQSGDIVFWKKAIFEDGTENAHTGFVISETEAISTNYKIKAIDRHDLKMREIEFVYRFNWENK